MKVIIRNLSGSLHGLGVISETGIIFMDNGEISHIISEKEFNRTVIEFKEEPKQEVVEVKKKSKK